MKLCLNRFQNNLPFLLKGTLVTLLLIALVGCSSGNGQAEVNPSESMTEIDELKADNEELQAELEKAIEALKEAESKVEGLESDLKDFQEAQAAPSPSPSAAVDLVAPERTSSQLLVGQWYLQDFNEDGQFSWTQTLVFNTNGTGTMSRRFYVPKSDVEQIEELKSYGVTFDDFDSSLAVSWVLNGNTVHITLDNGESGDFTFSPEQQLLQLKDGNDKYGKEQPSGMEGYVARALYADDVKAQEAARMRMFLGTWYFDLTTWTFNEDGTCIIDIPEWGDQPAATLEYTYSIYDDRNDPTYLCLVLDSEKGSSYFYPEFAADRSVSLKDSGGSEVMKLTRQFDMNNCPISTEIILNIYDSVTGRMFYDMLGIEE